MSEENVEVAHDVFAAYNRGGVGAALKYFDPDVELLAPPEWPEDHVLWGHAGVRKIMADWGEQLDDFHLDLERIIDAGNDGVVGLLIQRGRIKGSDRELEQPVGVHFEFRGGKVNRSQAYLSWEQALKAVGLI